MGSFLGSFASAGGVAGVSAVIGMLGPSYNPGQGGELRRQLATSTHGTGATRRPWSTPGMLDAFIEWCRVNKPDLYNGRQGVSVWDAQVMGSAALDAWVNNWASQQMTQGGQSSPSQQGGLNNTGGGGTKQGFVSLNPPQQPGTEIPEGAPVEYIQWSMLKQLWWRLTHGKAEWYEYLCSVLFVLFLFWLLYKGWRMLFGKRRRRGGRKSRSRSRSRGRARSRSVRA